MRLGGGARRNRVKVLLDGASGGTPREALQAVRAVCSLVWAGAGTVDIGLAATALVDWTAPLGWDR